MAVFSILTWGALAIGAAAIIVPAYYFLRTRSIAAEAERKVPPSGAFVAVDGNRVHYIDKGAGRPILFIHGLGAQLHQFAGPLFDLLRDDFRLIAIDRPGAGYSLRAKDATGRPSEQALIIRHFIELLELDRPLVVGHSLGGAIALALALDHSDVISGLALISPHTDHSGGIAPEFAALHIRSPFKRRLISETIAVPSSQQYADKTLAYIFGPQNPPDDYMTAGGGWLGLRPGHFYGSSTDFVALGLDYPQLQKRYGEITMPVGILFGTADNVLDYQKHGVEMVGKIGRLDLELAEGVGHMPQFAVPAQTTAFIRRIAARAFAG